MYLKKYILLFVILFLSKVVIAQTQSETAPQPASGNPLQDTLIQHAISSNDTLSNTFDLTDYNLFWNYRKKDTLHLTRVSQHFFMADSMMNFHINQIFIRQKPLQNHFFYYILALLLLLVFVKIFFAKFFMDLIKSATNYNFALNSFRQHDFSLSIPALVLTGVFFISTAIIIFIYFNNYEHVSTNSFLLVIYILGVLIGYHWLRLILYKLLNFIFNFKNEIEITLNVDKLFMMYSALILVPMILLIVYGAPLLITTTWIVLAIYIVILIFYRLFLAWQLSNKILINNLFHFILYICTLEIAPMLILIRLILNWNNFA